MFRALKNARAPRQKARGRAGGGALPTLELQGTGAPRAGPCPAAQRSVSPHLPPQGFQPTAIPFRGDPWSNWLNINQEEERQWEQVQAPPPREVQEKGEVDPGLSHSIPRCGRPGQPFPKGRMLQRAIP